MLDPGAFIEIKIFFYLGFLYSLGRLVDRKFNPTISITHYLAHQSRVLRSNLFIVEGKEIYEAHYVLIPFYPRIHLAPSYIANHVVNIFKTGYRGIII